MNAVRLTSKQTAWMAAGGFVAASLLFGFHPLSAQAGSSGLLGEFRAGEGETFITECMEAALMWKDDTIGWRLAATPQERTALRGKCSAAYASGEITPEMQDVRSGVRLVRDSDEGVRTTSVF
jgi:hypothetical protein